MAFSIFSFVPPTLRSSCYQASLSSAPGSEPALPFRLSAPWGASSPRHNYAAASVLLSADSHVLSLAPFFQNPFKKSSILVSCRHPPGLFIFPQYSYRLGNLMGAMVSQRPGLMVPESFSPGQASRYLQVISLVVTSRVWIVSHGFES